MTVLVDEARWPWRGGLWAHLVSDQSYRELHELARMIGKRRMGFQGDHYDVDTVDRERAIAAGAVAVESRQLVRRLVESGLRRANAKPRWEHLGSSPAGSSPAPTIAGLRAVATDGALRLVDALACVGPIATIGTTAAWGDEVRLAVIIDVGAGVDLPDGGDWVDLADEVVIGEARVDGARSVELFTRRWLQETNGEPTGRDR
jgi:hypothetical protein